MSEPVLASQVWLVSALAGPSLASCVLWVGPSKMRPSRAPLKDTPDTHPRSSSSTAVTAAGPSHQDPQQVPTLPLIPPGPSPTDAMPRLLWR